MINDENDQRCLSRVVTIHHRNYSAVFTGLELIKRIVKAAVFFFMKSWFSKALAFWQIFSRQNRVIQLTKLIQWRHIVSKAISQSTVDMLPMSNMLPGLFLSIPNLSRRQFGEILAHVLQLIDKVSSTGHLFVFARSRCPYCLKIFRLNENAQLKIGQSRSEFS